LFYKTSEKAMQSNTKLNMDRVHRESWKFIYFGVERSKVKVTKQKTFPAWAVAFP